MIELIREIRFQTSRSGGKGGQNVNKVETAVTASLDIGQSLLLSDEQKETIRTRLGNRINQEDCLQVKAQVHRTQLANKEEAVKKLLALVQNALQRKKPRIATKATKASKEKRLESKKRKAELKSGRQKFRPGEF